MKSPKPRAIGLLCAVAALAVAGVTLSQGRFNPIPHLISGLAPSASRPEFPAIDTSQLSPVQQKVVAVLQQEYAAQPAGAKYSEGVPEPWCADFVSWVFKEAGQPLVNPNSQSWRIPGTYTLREYYESTGRFRPANSGYSPQAGDIMLYDNPSPFGQHTNIVIKNDGGTITTVGGNERGSIRVFVHESPDGAGFLGYGALAN